MLRIRPPGASVMHAFRRKAQRGLAPATQAKLQPAEPPPKLMQIDRHTFPPLFEGTAGDINVNQPTGRFGRLGVHSCVREFEFALGIATCP